MKIKIILKEWNKPKAGERKRTVQSLDRRLTLFHLFPHNQMKFSFYLKWKRKNIEYNKKTDFV